MSDATDLLERYDPAAEVRRATWADIVVRGRRLNRLTATVDVEGAPEPEDASRLKAEHDEVVLPSTLVPEAPVVAVDWPTHGPFVLSPGGTYLDTYLGVAQKLLDEHHPAFEAMLDRLRDAGATLRREIATDDFMVASEESGVVMEHDLAALWAGALDRRWPRDDGYAAFFSSSGAEAVEAALKLCHQVAYKRFVARWSMATYARVQKELGFEPLPYFERDPALAEHEVFSDHPFQVVACEGAFHGRTLGALSLTHSKRAHKLAYPRPWQVRHVPYNDAGDPVRELVDMRPIDEILETPGELVRVVREQGRIPRDLFAGFVAEPFQGEGGYVPGDPGFFARARAVCDEAEGLLVVDEVQTVGRTGRLLMTEHLDVRPDVVAMAKSMVVGITVAPAELARFCHVGWHSNTWGGGRVLDVNFAHTTAHTLLEHRDPAFGGLSYLENEEVKGAMLRQRLDELCERHPTLLEGHRGVGLMNALLVRRRAEVVAAGWRHGLKLLGCGLPGEVAPIRLLMLADTLAREVDELVGALDRTLADVARDA